ncbi:MAG TPA: hypothetical protein VGM97_01655 [Steroidobacteraceae bacterium]|jgi:hypothetical protein
MGPIKLFAGPLAWFVEINIGYMLATEPCFPTDHRLVAPLPRWAWTQTGLYCLALLCLLVALWAFIASMSALRQHAAGGQALAAADTRERFAALWGAAFGGGFFVATLLTCVGLIVLPRCGG